MRLIDKYIAGSHEELPYLDTRGDFHNLLLSNVNNFLSENFDTLSPVTLHFFKATDVVSEIVKLKDGTYIAYNQLTGDFAHFIHYLALDEFNDQDFLVYKIMDTIKPMLKGIYPVELKLCFGSQFADQATSVTEMFIVYHEIGHLKFESISENDLLIQFVSMALETSKKNFHNESVVNPDNWKKMSLTEKEKYFLQLACGNSEDDRMYKIYCSDLIKEEIYCDIFSSDIVKEAYAIHSEETNLLLCGVSLLTYTIINSLFQLVDILLHGSRMESLRYIQSMYLVRTRVFTIYMMALNKTDKFLEIIQNYDSIHNALAWVWNFPVKDAGNPEKVQTLISDYQYSSPVYKG